MKRIFGKAILAAAVMATVCGLIVGCGGALGKDEAHGTVSRFFGELCDGDADGAVALMYPGLGVESAAFKNYVLRVEKECGISFTDGRSNMRVGVSESIGNDRYKVGGEVNIGEVRISFSAVVIKDGGGMGIFSIDIGGVRF